MMNIQFHIRTMMAAAVLLAGLAACSEDDSQRSALTTGAKQQLEINVVDAGGFTYKEPDASSRQACTMTRAVPDKKNDDDADYASTVFEMQDAIAVFQVKNGTVQKANVKYVYDGQHWTSANSISYDPDAEYFAYYPYQSQLPAGAPAEGTSVGTGKTDKQFFESMANQWVSKISKSQVTRQAYIQADLMIGKGQHSEDHSVTFPMIHTQSLLVLHIGYVKRVLRTSDYYWYEGLSTDFKTDGGEYRPLFLVNQYRCIIPPNTDVSIASTDGVWSINTCIDEAGCYQSYDIGYSDDNPTGGWSYYDVQLGDIMFRDGHFCHFNEANMDKIMGNLSNVIGFVIYVNNGTMMGQQVIDNRTDQYGRPVARYSQGLVMCKDYNSYEQANAYETWLHVLPNYALRYGNLSAATRDFDGLKRYDIAIDGGIENLSGNTYSMYTWMNGLARPSGVNTPCSPWFVPTAGQLFEALASAEILNDSVYNAVRNGDLGSFTFETDAVEVFNRVTEAIDAGMSTLTSTNSTSWDGNTDYALKVTSNSVQFYQPAEYWHGNYVNLRPVLAY